MVGHQRNKKENKRFLAVNENADTTSEPVGHSKGNSKRKVYSHECIY
jgi:hypothetical protein